MRARTNQFLINGLPMPAPDGGIDVSYSDLDSDETGRDESGVLHRIVAQYKVATWPFNYARLTKEDKAYLDSLFPNEPDFQFTHPSRKDPSVLVTTRCYRSSYGVSWLDLRTGDYRNYNFNIIACEGETGA